MPGSKNWALTLLRKDGVSDEEWDRDVVVFRGAYGSGYCTFLVYQPERCPQSGRVHLQGYVEYSMRRSAGQVKEHFGLDYMHVGPAYRSAARNVAYCTKEGGLAEPTRLGDPSGGQGARTDISEACEMVKKGGVALLAASAPETFVKYARGFQSLEQLVLAAAVKPGFRECKSWCFWGDTETGKTKMAWTFPDLFVLPVQQPKSLWFDGYKGEKSLLIDDFLGEIEFGALLRILDGYPCGFPMKGGFIARDWDRVIVTSNVHPSAWYPNKLYEGGPLERRLFTGGVVEFKLDGSHEVLVVGMPGEEVPPLSPVEVSVAEALSEMEDAASEVFDISHNVC